MMLQLEAADDGNMWTIWLLGRLSILVSNPQLQSNLDDLSNWCKNNDVNSSWSFQMPNHENQFFKASDT